MPLTLLRSWADGRGLWCKVDDTLFLGVAPLAVLGQPAQLQALGVRAVVNLCEEYAGPKAEYERLKMRQLRLPTVDHQEPATADLRKAVAFIEEQRALGHKVYVHCKAGHGRAAAVALAWLIFTRSAASEEEVRQLNLELLQKRHVRSYLYRQSNIRAFVEGVKATGGACITQDAGSEPSDKKEL
eukprot:CAMPEP_0181471500 /NCGR_PEP_ID=MMETSP1110-20121109/39105_1 /TAXON_ID=174948 /ORGANISM="Symbiodinium sp., Strain CCMP421" /LENGTH=184 /DNA_ID=CAMNT_0023596517 /DNA_START=246 /DNA_END=800 /DNA_ORIENTATION=-